MQLGDKQKKAAVSFYYVFGVIGLLLRFSFMPFTLHSDLLYIFTLPAKVPAVIGDVYGYIKSGCLGVSAPAATYYGPVAYVIISGFLAALDLLLPGIRTWFASYDLCSGDASYPVFLSALSLKKLGLYLSATKTIYLALDVICLVLILRFFKTERQKKRGFILWALNPVVIFGSYVFGNIDIMLSAMLLLSLVLFMEKKSYAAFLCLGFSVFIKSFPLLLLLPLLLLKARNIREGHDMFVRFLLPCSIVLLLSKVTLRWHYGLGDIIPRFLGGGGANLADTWEFMIGKVIFAGSYLFINLKIMSIRKRNIHLCAWKVMLAVILMSYFIIFTPVHYFQWAIPLLIIGVVLEAVPLWAYWVQIVCLFVYALCSKAVGPWLLMPLDPDYFYGLKSIPEFMNQFLPWGVVMRTARLLFDLISVFIVYKLIFKPEVKRA